jgi:tetratricopeptide (TPR) repeat protein
VRPLAQAAATNIAGNCLCAQSRLHEALALSENAVTTIVCYGKRFGRSASIHARMVSEINLIFGRIPAALKTGTNAVRIADNIGPAEVKVRARVILADALHQGGFIDESRRLFTKAAAMEAEREPEDPGVGLNPARRAVALWRGVYQQDRIEAHPILTRAFSWLDSHLPSADCVREKLISSLPSL